MAKCPLLLFLGILVPNLCLSGQTVFRQVPDRIAAEKKYIFYLHGRIIEEQGMEAESEQYGKYKYEKILQALAAPGYCVISEPRPKGTDSLEYARKVAAQIEELLQGKVPAGNIMVVGASKGAGIAVLVSHLLKNPGLKFVVMAICSSGMAAYWEKNGVRLWGKVLYIYDHKDRIAGSCQAYLEVLRSSGLIKYEELELKMGLGHGILYAPYREWIVPAMEWMKR